MALMRSHIKPTKEPEPPKVAATYIVTTGKQAREEQNFTKQPFLLTIDEVTIHLKTRRDSGLRNLQAQGIHPAAWREQTGWGGAIKWYLILLKQIPNAMILVLVLAMALSYGVTDFVEGGVVTGVIVFNVAIGFHQEFHTFVTDDLAQAGPDLIHALGHELEREEESNKGSSR